MEDEKNKIEEEKEEIKLYHMGFKITDRQMKPQDKAFTQTKDRIHWIEKLILLAKGDNDAYAQCIQRLDSWFPMQQYAYKLVDTTDESVLPVKEK